MASFRKNIIALAAAVAAVIAPRAAAAESRSVEPPALVEVKPGAFQYWAAGEFTRESKPVDPPHLTVPISAPISIMKHEVSVKEYSRCVEERACAPLTGEQARADVPAVMVSWNDAQAYASWLSKRLGEHYRLPSDEEWTYAAGSRAPNEAPLGNADAVARWVARYDSESEGRPADALPQPIGHFGANENGLFDIAGNVWEWTDACYTRTVLDAVGKPVGPGTVNCGVRIAEGRHRAYVVDFIRDARAGGCAVGVPPSNLGFRLVRDNRWTWSLF
jgi:formylglycine-generating enzyme required for sulfatase activity